MEWMVGKYRNPGYLPIDPDCNADHIPNTVIITKRVYDILCNGVGMILPFVLLMTGVIRYRTPSVICIGCSFLLMIGLIMFKRKEFKEEMHKKFHVG